MKNKFYLLLLFLMAIVVLPTSAQITFKLKSVVGSQNPSSNGLFSYGTLNNGTFQLFPYYGEDGTGVGINISQKGWTFVLGQENYPFLAFEQLNAAEITPQPFPPFGIFMHPSQDLPSVVKLSIPNNATIISIINKVQRPSFGCGESIGYSIVSDNSTILPRTIVSTSASPNTYMVGSTFINAGNNIYFVVDKGEDGNSWCDDTAIDVEITLLYEKIVTPKLSGTLNCSTTSATFDIAFQQSGTLSLYKLGNTTPIATTTISQVGNTFNGQGTFTGLDLSSGGSYYAIASNAGQTSSAQSETITFVPCCVDGIAPLITVNNAIICSGETSTLTASGCTGNISWDNGKTGSSIVVSTEGTYTATCTVKGTAPCADGISTASGTVRVNPLPLLNIGNTYCSADLLTYSVDFTSNSPVTSTLGVVSGNTASGIPIGKNTILVATTSNGCTILQNVVSPTCNCPMLEAPISEGDKTICSGATIPSLSVKVGSNEVVNWYDTPTGGNLLLANSLTFTAKNAGTFYASARNAVNNCVSSTRTAVTLTINPLPTLVINDTNCSPNLLTYSVSFTSNSTVTSTLGVVSGNIVSGIQIGKNTILVATTSNGCTISQNVVSPTCNCPMLEAPKSDGDKTICSGATIPSLSVKVGSNEMVDWYDAPTGGNLLLANSLTFTAKNAGTFYASARNIVNNCVSSTRTAVMQTINPLPTLVINDTNCSPNLLTYSVSFTSNSPVTSTLGVVTGNIVSGIPIGSSPILTATTSNGCTISQNIVSPICNCPNVPVPISDGDKTICSGATIPSLSVKVGSNEMVDWYDAPMGGNLLLANSLTFTPKNAGTFYASAHNIINNCESSTRTAVTLTINAIGAIPVIIASKTSIILGESSILSINNCNGTVLWNTGENTMNITVLPIKTTIYSATCTANSVCVGGTGSIEINVEAPKIAANASPSTVCANGSTVLSMTGCPTNAIYWIAKLDGGRLDFPMPTINNILQSQTFTGYCETSAGTTTADITIEVRQAQDFQIAASSNQIIFGESAQLSSNACDGTLTWNTGQVGNVITIKPDKTTTYSAVCNGATSCGGSGQITITVKPPKVEILGGNVCFGQTTTLSQKGCNYAFGWVMWKKDDFSDAISLESPAIFLTERTHIRFTCATPAGDAIEEKVIEPIPLPNKPEMVTDKSNYILGEIAEVNALNCNGYLKWSNGEEGKVQIRVKPDRTTIYTAICQGGLGCSAENSVEVIVKTDSPKAQDLILCYGDTLTLKSGCATGTKAHWTENWFDIPNRIERIDGEKVKLFETKIYAVSCEGSAGYSDAVVIKVSVKSQVQKPTIEAEKSIIIKGDSLELFANGCNETEWMTDNSLQISANSNKVIVKPTTTTIFSARCKVDGCYSDYGSLKVLVRPKMPIVKASFDTLCVGNSTTITVQNCEDGGILKWLHSNVERHPNDANSFDITPKKDTTYQAVCISLDNTERHPLISDTTIVKIKVYQTPKAPTISASRIIIIEDERTTLTATNCEGMITWNTGATTRTLTVNPTRNTTYSATCTIWKCVSEKAEMSIKVRPKQLEITDGNETAYFLNDTLCLEKQITLSVVTTCNGTFVWSNGQSGRNITIVGTKNEIYEVFCQNADNEKSDISRATILVKDYNIVDAYVYPNPTSGKLFIQSKGCIDGVMLRLYTLRGELIYEGGGQERYLDSLVLDLFNLPSEEYVLHIIGTDGTKPVTLRKRVIKTNK